jgi:ornithine cyclodeaminase/alanine dehydrogenase-like protein (mu-crystallin family)
MQFEEYPDTQFRYLTRAQVVAACRSVDIVAAVGSALVQHADGGTVLPDEAYLGWTTPGGHAARLLAMPGAVTDGGRQVLGLKTINASTGNPARGLPRSQGFTLLVDPETARPLALMEAAYISAMRTAAVTVLAVTRLAAPAPARLALIGCGTLAQAHATMLLPAVPTLAEVRVHDTIPERAAALAGFIAGLPGGESLKVSAADTPRDCVDGADIVVPVTTSTEGYIGPGWLKPGALVAHVSLDDLTEAAVLAADLVVVDDWGLVSADPRRLLGQMYRRGTLLGPDGQPCPGVTPSPAARRADTSLGDILAGRHPGRSAETDLVISNPFGMAILDVAVADRVLAAAAAEGLGTMISL